MFDKSQTSGSPGIGFQFGMVSISRKGLLINPIQDGGNKKGPPTSFSPVTSTNV